MNTARINRKITRLNRQLGDSGVPVPRDGLPASYYVRKNREKLRERLKESSLEQDAKKFALWAMGKKGEAPFNPFTDTKRIHEIVQYLNNHNYIHTIGQTPKELIAHGYHLTPEGKKWAYEK
jgi:hypothetical protein